MILLFVSLLRHEIFSVGVVISDRLSTETHPYYVGYVNTGFQKVMSLKHEINSVPY